MINAIIDHFTIRNSNAKDLMDVKRTLNIAKLVTGAATLVFAMLSATSILGLAPMRAALYAGCAYLSQDLASIPRQMELKIAPAERNLETNRSFNKINGNELIEDALKSSHFFNVIADFVPSQKW